MKNHRIQKILFFETQNFPALRRNTQLECFDRKHDKTVKIIMLIVLFLSKQRIVITSVTL